MGAEMDMHKRGSIMRNRLLIGFGWLLGLIVVAFVYDQAVSRVARHNELVTSFPEGFLVRYLPYLAVQSILYWIVLARLYPRKQAANVASVLLMNVLFLVCYAAEAAVLLALGTSALG